MSLSNLSRDTSGFQDGHQYGLESMKKCTMTETTVRSRLPSGIPTFSKRIDWTVNCQHCSMSAVIARRRPTSEIQHGGHQSGSTMYLWNGMIYRRNSNGLTHIFDHARTTDATPDIFPCRPISAIQNTLNGGL
jgi:hypothetical protein